LASTTAAAKPTRFQSFNAQTWGSWYKLQLWSNFSLFLNDPVNGDGIEQNDKRFLAGNNLNYRRNYNLWDLPMETLVGFQSRFDHIRVGLFNQSDRRRRDTVKNNNIEQTNLGWFMQQEIRSTAWLRTQIGARMDNFWYDVEPIGTVAEPISGSGSATIVTPKLNFIFTPFDDRNLVKGTDLFLNFGGGFHSNDARVFVQDPKKKLPRYWGGEVGAKSRLFDMRHSPIGDLTSKANWYLSAMKELSSLAVRAAVTALRASFATTFFRGCPTISIFPPPGHDLSMETGCRSRRVFSLSPASRPGTTPASKHACRCATSDGVTVSRTAVL